MAVERVGLAFLGAGIVGSSAIEETIKLALSEGLEIRGVLVRDLEKQRSFDLQVTKDFNQIINDPDVKIVISLLGDESVEHPYILEALRRGKFVVTANKEIIAKEGPQLFNEAQSHQVGLLFEAAAAGGIQIVDNLLNRYNHNNFSSFAGIVNGTTNYVLTEMAKGKDYQTALQEAQDAGFAESDSTNDVEGYDARYKLSIIASLAFKGYVSPNQIHTEGITGLEAGDFEYASRLGYVIKLIASAKKIDGDLELWVCPALVPSDHPLAKIKGSLNGLFFDADPIGSFTLQGRGAGGRPTASAVLADILSARDHILNKSVPRNANLSKPLTVRPFERIRNRYFLRMVMSEDPGTLSKVSGILGNYGVSIHAVEQEEDKTDGNIAECVFTTRESEEGKIAAALKEISNLDIQAHIKSVLRILPG